MPVDRDAQLLSLLEQRQMLRILRVEVLIDRTELQTTQPQVIDAVSELLDAGRVIGIDRTPAGKAIWVLSNKRGHGFLIATNAGEWRLNGEDDYLVAVLRRLQQLLGSAIEVVLPACV